MFQYLFIFNFFLQIYENKDEDDPPVDSSFVCDSDTDNSGSEYTPHSNSEGSEEYISDSNSSIEIPYVGEPSQSKVSSVGMQVHACKIGTDESLSSIIINKFHESGLISESSSETHAAVSSLIPELTQGTINISNTTTLTELTSETTCLEASSRQMETDESYSEEQASSFEVPTSQYSIDLSEQAGSSTEGSYILSRESTAEAKTSCSVPKVTNLKVSSAKVSSSITVKAVNNKNGRQWDKKHCCPYCTKMFPKLARHMEQVHSSEIDVAKALALPKNSEKRKKQWEQLRHKGNFAYNSEVIKHGKGEIIPFRRPTGQDCGKRYTPCDRCLGFFVKEDLWKHRKKCPAISNEDVDVDVSGPHSYQQAAAALLPACDKATATFKEKILNTMMSDQVSLVARQDELITKFGLHMFAKHGHLKHQHNYIKQKMRELSRFLITARSENKNVDSLCSCIDPVNFKTVVASVKQLAGFDQSKGAYEVPSLALKLGHSLKKCAQYLKAEALQSNDSNLKERAEGFYACMEVEWSSNISSQALTSLNEEKFNKPRRLPLAEDIKKLNEYLKSRAAVLSESIKTSPNDKDWRDLTEVTLAQLTLFNRRRGGEMERMTIQSYSEGIISHTEMQEEIASSLSEMERQLAKKMKRVEIRGKRGRKVAVLLTECHQEQINLLNKTRKAVNIATDNNYQFPRLGESRTPVRSSDVLRAFAKECGAENPEYLTSTSLRKHIAVVTQLLNLKDHEMDIVAGFMGHDIRIHRQYYRLPEETLQLCKVSKILLNMENGRIPHFQGKSLDEITVNPDGMSF